MLVLNWNKAEIVSASWGLDG
jgi:hypothetical protein